MDDVIRQAGIGINGRLARSRKVLSMDEILRGKNHHMRFEVDMPSLTMHDGKRPFFYTVDLILDGVFVQGALLAGSCALIFAHTRRAADELAEAGLKTTLEAGFDYAFGEEGTPLIVPELEFGGRKGTPDPVTPDTLRTDQRTKETIINRAEEKARDKRWKH
jgi:hypothetical protein